MRVAELELDLDVFSGPFDLLLTLVLREEVDLLEVDLADVVLSYLDHLETRGALAPGVAAGPGGGDRIPLPQPGAARAEVPAHRAARRGRVARPRSGRRGRGTARA